MTDLPDFYPLLPGWARDMLAAWQGCGPWVEDADLNEEGRAVRAAFLWMLASDRRAAGYLVKAARREEVDT